MAIRNGPALVQSLNLAFPFPDLWNSMQILTDPCDMRIQNFNFLQLTHSKFWKNRLLLRLNCLFASGQQ